MKKVLCFMVILFCLVDNLTATAQVSYFKQVKTLTINSLTIKQLLFKLDSLKQTRRPHDSGIQLNIDRNLDFGYRHQRYLVTLNGDRSTLDLLSKNDSMIVKIVSWGNTLMDNDAMLKTFGESARYRWADSVNANAFINKRNKLYSSHKTIKDLKFELSDPVIYAFRCGEAYSKTLDFQNVESLVKKKDLAGLLTLLTSFSAENQAFGVAGIKLLKKTGYKIPKDIMIIINHIDKRNSDLIVCNGCIVGLVAKANK